MGRRGRRPHPDILTPREWEVLGLLRERLTNEQIAERLGITLDGAKYHVSEILSKLGVATREEAAAWEPEERRPWWQRLVALPVAAKIAAVTTLVVAGAGIAATSGAIFRLSDEREEFAETSSTIIDAGNIDDYVIGKPVHFENLDFWLVRLDEGEVVALMDVDTHSRFIDDECRIVFREDVLFLNRNGWFRGSCSGSNFDLDGSLVSGPSPLGMYRFHVDLIDGRVLVDIDFPLCPDEQPPNAACPRPPAATSQ